MAPAAASAEDMALLALDLVLWALVAMELVLLALGGVRSVLVVAPMAMVSVAVVDVVLLARRTRLTILSSGRWVTEGSELARH